MDIRQLTYFLGVVDHGGFGRAATQLHVSQPALSQAVAALEKSLGTALFHRVPSGVRLTDAGSTLVPHARTVLRDLYVARAATRSVGHDLTGRVDLALMPSQAIDPFPRLLTELTRRHPRIDVTAAAAFSRDEAIEKVLSGACELGLVGALPAAYPATVTAHTLARQETVLLAPPTCPLPTDRPLAPADLDGLRLIASPPGSVMRQMGDRLCAQSSLRVSVEVEHRSAILPLVVAGVGVAVLSSAWADLATRTGLRVHSLQDPLEIQVDLIHRHTALTPAAQSLLEVAISQADEAHSELVLDPEPGDDLTSR